ncbi:MAG: hypothetical protein NT092_03845 [Bacteroidia bacterium]|nr:hypothetical protein [Bacteroidia bacterium]
MEKHMLAILLMPLLFMGCNDSNKPGNTKTSGTETIDNSLYGTTVYYGIGFNFSAAEKVSSLATPKPDITIGNDGTLTNLILQTDNYKDSFYKAGEYTDANSAEKAFDALTSLIFPTWESWAYSIKPNQIWIFRTSAEKYAKIRIITTLSEARYSRDYAECTFEWVYQPDGTLTFPGK